MSVSEILYLNLMRLTESIHFLRGNLLFMWCMLSPVQLFATPWTVAHPGSSGPWNFLGKNIGVGAISLHGIFPTQGSNPTPAWQADSLPLCHLRSPMHAGNCSKLREHSNIRHMRCLLSWNIYSDYKEEDAQWVICSLKKKKMALFLLDNYICNSVSLLNVI